MFVSVIIATIGRESLNQAVESVLRQGLPESEFEIIVVNDRKQPLEFEDWHGSASVRILSTGGRERSVARNTGAAVSQGKYLLFLDDDDWLLSGGLQELKTLAGKTSAAWIYGASRFVAGDGKVLVDHHIGVEGNVFVQVMAAEWLPIQASLIRSDAFFKAGGFETDPRIIGSEDKDLCRKIARCENFAQTPNTVSALLRDRTTTTTNYRMSNRQSLFSRDNIIGKRGAFRRMWDSADSSYWRGRMVRAYLTCVLLNMQRRSALKTIFLLAATFLTTLMSWRDMARPDFWRAVLRSHTRPNVA